MEETLLLLPFSAACDILQKLPALLKGDYHAELLARLALCLIQAHHGPIIANQNLLPTLEIVKKLALKKITTLRVMQINLLLFIIYLLHLLLLRDCYLFDELIDNHITGYYWFQSAWYDVHPTHSRRTRRNQIL